MLIVELNLAGYRFSREIPELRHKPLRSVRFSPRTIQWRMPQLRHTARGLTVGRVEGQHDHVVNDACPRASAAIPEPRC